MLDKSDSEMEVDEVVVKIFLNTRLGCREENLSQDSDTARIIAKHGITKLPYFVNCCLSPGQRWVGGNGNKI